MLGITLDGVTKRYGDVVALDGVDLTVATGRCHCLLGPNGSGKTTLLHLLLGLTSPTAGTVDRDGATLGCSFQSPTFYPDLTVSENLDVFAAMAPPPEAAWRADLVDLLGLERVADRLAGALSGGWQQKLDLALAFMKRPTVAVLDEPLDDLDAASEHRVRSFLADYPDADHGLLVATHQVEAFAGTLDHLTVLDRGTVRHDGPVADAAAAEATYHDLIGDG